MNELDDMERVRLLRDTVPWPAPARLAGGRGRLLAETRDASRHAPRQLRFTPRPGNSRRLATLTAAAAAVTVAAGIAGYAISTRTAPAAGHAPTGPVSAQAVLAAKVLGTAASHVALQGVSTEPSPGQWIYSKTVDDETPPQGYPVDENWITFDGADTAYYQGGQLVVHASPVPLPKPGTPVWAAWNADISPKTAYDVLASLPGSPQALLAVIAHQIAGQTPSQITQGTPWPNPGPSTKAQLEFDYLARVLWNAAGGVGGPPAAEAAVYRALAALPGISVQKGITDAAGNPAIGISDDGGYDQLLISPVSYQVTGLRQLSTGLAPAVAPSELAIKLRALLTGPNTPAAYVLPGSTMSLGQLRKQFAQASTARQDKLLAQWAQQWAQARNTSAPVKGTVVDSIADAQVTEVAGPGQQ